MDPQNKVALNNRGCVLAKQGNYADAVQCLNKAAELDPHDSSAHRVKGEAFINQER